MAKLSEIVYADCPHCAGNPGKLPDAGTGAVLRAEREKAGVSRAAVASALDVSEAYLGDLERGNRDWSNARVEAFRKALVELGA